MSGHTDAVLAEVAAERERQDERWGPQRLADNHTEGGTVDSGVIVLGRPYAQWAQLLKIRCDTLAKEQEAGGEDRRSMTLVLLEEVFEALERAVQGHPRMLREELVQVAAVAVKWVEIIDWREVTAAEAERPALHPVDARRRNPAGRRGLSCDETASMRSASTGSGGKKPVIRNLELPEGTE